MFSSPMSGKKKEPKPKLFDPDFFGWGGGLPREGLGIKKFGIPTIVCELLSDSQKLPAANFLFWGHFW